MVHENAGASESGGNIFKHNDLTSGDGLTPTPFRQLQKESDGHRPTRFPALLTPRLSPAQSSATGDKSIELSASPNRRRRSMSFLTGAALDVTYPLSPIGNTTLERSEKLNPLKGAGNGSYQRDSIEASWSRLNATTSAERNLESGPMSSIQLSAQSGCRGTVSPPGMHVRTSRLQRDHAMMELSAEAEWAQSPAERKVLRLERTPSMSIPWFAKDDIVDDVLPASVKAGEAPMPLVLVSAAREARLKLMEAHVHVMEVNRAFATLRCHETLRNDAEHLQLNEHPVARRTRQESAPLNEYQTVLAGRRTRVAPGLSRLARAFHSGFRVSARHSSKVAANDESI